MKLFRNTEAMRIRCIMGNPGWMEDKQNLSIDLFFTSIISEQNILTTFLYRMKGFQNTPLPAQDKAINYVILSFLDNYPQSLLSIQGGYCIVEVLFPKQIQEFY